jgi:hypothetical protein
MEARLCIVLISMIDCCVGVLAIEEFLGNFVVISGQEGKSHHRHPRCSPAALKYLPAAVSPGDGGMMPAGACGRAGAAQRVPGGRT